MQRNKPVLLFILACVLFSASAYAQVSRPDAPLVNAAEEAKARALFTQLRCMVCDGQSLADSNAPLAQDMRRLVRSRIAAGQSPDQILDYLANRYGESIRMRPPLNTHTLPLWLGPVLIIIIGALIFRHYFAASRREES